MFARLPPEATGVRTENRYKRPADARRALSGIRRGLGGHRGGNWRLRRRRPARYFRGQQNESCRLFRNLGNFKFEDVTERAGVGDVGAAAIIWKSGATFVDVNNDGRLDLYVAVSMRPICFISTKVTELQGDGARLWAGCEGFLGDGGLLRLRSRRLARRLYRDHLLSNAAGSKGRRGYLFHNQGGGTFAK